jgi:glucokinase
VQYIGVDIGGTKCAVSLGRYEDDSIYLCDKVRFDMELKGGPYQTINKIVQDADRLLTKNHIKKEELRGIGISCGGPLDSKRGVILSPPNLPGWDAIPIVEILEKKFGVKARLQNDANACALAEWKFGAGKGCDNVIFLTFGTGMGAGLILNGRLYSGTNDMAGEVGHIRLENYGPVGYGKSGAFEGFCSGGGIARLARIKVLERLQIGEKVSFCNSVEQLDAENAKIVGDAAEAGDELAKEIYRISGQYLGRGLSVLIDILNPQVIVIGSIFSRSRELLWPAAEEVIRQESLSYARNVCRVVPASLGEAIGDYAAMATAVYSDLYLPGR